LIRKQRNSIEARERSGIKRRHSIGTPKILRMKQRRAIEGHPEGSIEELEE
jgi:hypothetical protein